MIVVNIGELLECDETEEIATRGCDPCVALIAIYNNGIGDHGSRYIKKCAHFSVEMDLRSKITQQRIETALNPVLTTCFPLTQNIRRVGFSTGGCCLGMGATEITSRLRSYFSEQLVVQWGNRDSLRTVNDVIWGFKNQIWPFTHAHRRNSYAELNDRDAPALELKEKESPKT